MTIFIECISDDKTVLNNRLLTYSSEENKTKWGGSFYIPNSENIVRVVRRDTLFQLT